MWKNFSWSNIKLHNSNIWIEDKMQWIFLGRNLFWTINCCSSVKHSANGRLGILSTFFLFPITKIMTYTLDCYPFSLFACVSLFSYLLNIFYLCLLYCDLARLLLSLRTTNLTFTLYVLLSWCYVLVYMYVCMCTCTCIIIFTFPLWSSPV